MLVLSCCGKVISATGLKVRDAALALVALEQPKLPNAALLQALLSPAENVSSSCLGIFVISASGFRATQRRFGVCSFSAQRVVGSFY